MGQLLAIKVRIKVPFKQVIDVDFGFELVVELEIVFLLEVAFDVTDVFGDVPSSLTAFPAVG